MEGTTVCLFSSSQEKENSTAGCPPPPVWQKPEAKKSAAKQAVSAVTSLKVPASEAQASAQA